MNLHRNVVLKVNGGEHNVSIKDNETLLDVLRDKLELTGTKKDASSATAASAPCWSTGSRSTAA